MKKIILKCIGEIITIAIISGIGIYIMLNYFAPKPITVPVVTKDNSTVRKNTIYGKMGDIDITVLCIDGVQYLSSSTGGLTARYSVDGEGDPYVATCNNVPIEQQNP